MSTQKYCDELKNMEKLVLEGGTEGRCANEKILRDRNDNDVNIVMELEENGVPYRVSCMIYFASQVSREICNM